jgi:hypothetical protein
MRTYAARRLHQKERSTSSEEIHIVTLFTPKGSNITAQGNALGQVPPGPQAPSGRSTEMPHVIGRSHPRCLSHHSIAIRGERYLNEPFLWEKECGPLRREKYLGLRAAGRFVRAPLGRWNLGGT